MMLLLLRACQLTQVRYVYCILTSGHRRGRLQHCTPLSCIYFQLNRESKGLKSAQAITCMLPVRRNKVVDNFTPKMQFSPHFRTGFTMCLPFTVHPYARLTDCWNRTGENISTHWRLLGTRLLSASVLGCHQPCVKCPARHTCTVCMVRQKLGLHRHDHRSSENSG